MKRGIEYFNDNMDLVFPKDEKYECTAYDTCFTGFAHNGIILADSNENLSLGLRRLTSKRLQDGVGADEVQLDLDDRLSNNQTEFFKRHDVISMYNEIADVFDEYCVSNGFHKDTMDSASIEEFVQELHSKRLLRMNGLREIYIDGKWYSIDWMYYDVLVKCKKYEVSKFAKYIRIIMDLGVHASIQGAELIKHFKNSINLHEFKRDYGNGRGIRFVFIAKPDLEVLTHYLKMLWWCEMDEDLLLVHSDDAMLSYVDGSGKRKVVCCDLKQCDGSQLEPAISAFFSILRSPRVVECLVAQLKRDIRIVSTQGLKVVLKAKKLWFPSGHVMTTSANTCSYFAIAIAIAANGGVRDDNDLRRIGQLVGFLIEIVECMIPQDMQFLKHSLVLCLDGEWRAVLNAGVWMRASGRCFRELPGSAKVSYWDRAAEYQCLLMYGMIGNIRVKELYGVYILDEKRAEYFQRGLTKAEGKKLLSFHDRFRELTTEEVNTRPIVHCSVQEYFARYRLTEGELTELVDYVSRMEIGYYVYCSAVSKVLTADYGLTCPLE